MKLFLILIRLSLPLKEQLLYLFQINLILSMVFIILLLLLIKPILTKVCIKEIVRFNNHLSFLYYFFGIILYGVLIYVLESKLFGLIQQNLFFMALKYLSLYKIVLVLIHLNKIIEMLKTMAAIVLVLSLIQSLIYLVRQKQKFQILPEFICKIIKYLV